MKMCIFKIILLGGLINFSGGTHYAYGQIIVSDAILEFNHSERLIQSIAVGNASYSNSLNVHAEVEEIVNIGRQGEERLKTKTVFATPENFNLSPRSQRTVQLFSSKRSKDKEQVFRIVFKPVNMQQNTSQETSNLSLLTTTAIMMILTPPNPVENLTWEREDARVVFHNQGNTNVVLRRKGECAKDIICTIDGQRLWAGDKWILNLPDVLQEEPLTLEMRSLGQVKEIVVPYED